MTDNLADNEFVAHKLLKVNEHNNVATDIKLPKENANHNNFEECIKSSKPISLIFVSLIDQYLEIKAHLKLLLPIKSWKEGRISPIEFF